RMGDAGEAELGDVDHALDSAEVDEGAVVLERRDFAAEDGAGDEPLAGGGGGAPLVLLEGGAARGGGGLCPLGRDLEDQALADEGRGVLDVTDVELRDRAEAAHAGDGDLDAALVDRGDQALDGEAEGGRLLELGLGDVAGAERVKDDAARLARGLDDAALDGVPDADAELAALVAKLDDVDHPLGLGAEV